MRNVNFDEIRNIIEEIKECLELLPSLHRDVLEMFFGLDGGSPMTIKDIAWQLGEEYEYMNFTPDVVEGIKTEGLHMLRNFGKTNRWEWNDKSKDYDPSGFAHLTWKEVDRMIFSADRIDEIREDLRKRYADSDYVTIPTLMNLYEYDGDCIGNCDDIRKPGADDYNSLKEDMYNVVNLLEGMGKIILPDKSLCGKSPVPYILEYSYLGIEDAEKIVLKNTCLINS